MTLRAVLIDIDGTIVRGEQLLPGAAEAVRAIRDAGLEVLFLSNNPTRTSPEYAVHLRELGVDAADEEVLTSATATADYLAREYADDRLLVIGSDALVAVIEERGLTTTDDPAAADAVIASFDRTFDYDDLTHALWAIESGADLIGTDPDRNVPAENDRVVPGSGAIIEAIAAAAEREPNRVLGKPSAATAELALDRVGVEPSEALMIGDRLTTDVELGRRAGMETALVLTGVSDRASIDETAVTPDHVLDSLADVRELLPTPND